MINILDITKEDLIAIKVAGKVEKKDYDILDPLLEKTKREHDSLKLYLHIGDIEGITPQALIKDVITYFKHVKSLRKVAVVGEHKGEKNWAKIADPFIKADIKFFPLAENSVALEWIGA